MLTFFSQELAALDVIHKSVWVKVGYSYSDVLCPSQVDLTVVELEIFRFLASPISLPYPRLPCRLRLVVRTFFQ